MKDITTHVGWTFGQIFWMLLLVKAWGVSLNMMYHSGLNSPCHMWRLQPAISSALKMVMTTLQSRYDYYILNLVAGTTLEYFLHSPV